jgi:(1->4)-alpha-D-glucan 1-alpha-D-glucosylmutase
MSPDEHYEGVVRRFVEAVMTDVEFLDGLDRFVAPLVDPGRVNSLTLVALRLLAPGVPDTYQGTELWDDSLVDPDNRRPVDFTAHAAMLESIEARSAADLWREDRESGAPKLALVRDCLRVRADHPDAFGVGGSYRPFDVEGADAGHVVAFTRGDEVAVVVPRLVMKSTFGDARVALPPGRWHNVLTGADHGGGSLPFTEVRDDFPVAVLERLGPNFGEKQAP